MFVFAYLREIVTRAAKTWGNGLLLVLALGPAALAVVYRLVPSFPRNLDDPLLLGAIAWLILLLFVITPARVWDEQRKALASDRGGTPKPLSGLFPNATIEHSTLNFYLADGRGRIVTSESSNTFIRTPDYDAILYPGGTAVHAQAQAALGTGEAHDATIKTED